MSLNRTLDGLSNDDARRKGFRIPVREYTQILSVYLRRQRLRILLLGALIAAGILLKLINPQIVRQFLDSAASSAPLTVLHRYAGAFLGIAILIRIIRALRNYIGRVIAWKSTNALRSDLVAHVLSLDMPYHTKHPSGELIGSMKNLYSRYM